MDTEALERVEAELRTLAGDVGLDWVVAEVDEEIALGITESRRMRKVSSRGRSFYEDVGAQALGERARGRPRGEEFVARRPLQPDERVRALLSALRRVLVDAPQIAAQTLDDLGLGRGESAPAPAVRSIVFLPDEGDVREPVVVADVRRTPDDDDVDRIIADLIRECES